MRLILFCLFTIAHADDVLLFYTNLRRNVTYDSIGVIIDIVQSTYMYPSLLDPCCTVSFVMMIAEIAQSVAGIRYEILMFMSYVYGMS